MELDEESSPASVKTTSSVPSFDYASADQEYERLIKFVPTLPQPTRSHITGFLYPLYVYVFIYLLSEDKLSDAQKFLSSYAAPFLSAEGYGSVVKLLFEFKTIQDVKNHSYFKRFCESKYVVKTSEDSLKCFTSYLKEAHSTILLSILFSHLHVEGIENENHTISSPNNYVVKEKALNTPTTNQETEIPENSTLEAKVELKTALKKTESYLYTVTDCEESLCVADINSKSNLLACGFSGSTIRLWTLIPGSETQKKNKESPSLKYSSDDSKESQASAFENKTLSYPNPDEILHGHDGSVFGLAFTPNNELLMSCSEDCTARAWNLKDYKNVVTYSDHKYPIWDIAVSSDSKYFATASKDCTSRLWCFERSVPLRIFVGHSADVDCVKFHSNGQYIASASSDKTIRLWTVKDARSVRHFTGHSSYISSIAFSPKGHHLASADDSGCIKIWDLGSGKQINEVHAYRKRILSIAYNKSGSLLAFGGFDKCLNVWDVQSCTNMKESLTENPYGITNFSPMAFVDSTATDSILHLVSFRKRDVLLSVTTNCSK